MYSRTRVWSLALAILLIVPAGAASVDFKSLLSEMTDLSVLSEFPSPPYTCRQFSSYDRHSTDAAVQTDQNWYANGDAGQFIRSEKHGDRTEYVMMDTAGPGAIVRFWSANANDGGTVRFYLDGASTPTIEMPMQDMLNGKNWPYVAPIAGVHSMGWNSYLPIPYAKHCKVTADKNRFYYQLNYRSYGPKVKVRTFKPTDIEKNRQAIMEVARVLAHPETIEAKHKPKDAMPVGLRLTPGAQDELMVHGKGAIVRFTLKATAADMESALRKTLLSISFDGEAGPSVLCPLGDFFGSAPGLNVYAGLPLGMRADGVMYCNWVMPFQKQAAFRFVNNGTETVTLSGSIVKTKQGWNNRSLYFHAKWRMEEPIPTRPRRDWTYVSTIGQGVFVGDSLNITNPVAAWWGEGDEKIYVDGEKFPSTFGTGSEDYYGYAWCCPEPFMHAYHNQPRCDGPGNYGQTSVNRFHIMDNIPYTTSFKFDIEVWHWADTKVGMAAVSYWYARPGGTDDFRPVVASDLRIPALPGHKKVKGALEGEDLEVLARSGGVTEKQPLDAMEWSGGNHLWWRGAKVGDTLTLALPVEKAGNYDVLAVFTRAPDYGIMQLAINGQDVGEPMDFYARGINHTRERSLGTYSLKAGKNELKVRITGKNDRAVPNYMFGLDYILLRPVK